MMIDSGRDMRCSVSVSTVGNVTSVQEAIQIANENKQTMLESGFVPLSHKGDRDPGKSKLDAGEVRVLVSLNKSFLGFTYNSITLEQKFSNGRQGIFLDKTIALANGDKIKLRCMSEIE